MNTESILMLDCDGHVIESMSELAEYGNASIRWLTPGQKDIRRLPFPQRALCPNHRSCDLGCLRDVVDYCNE